MGQIFVGQKTVIYKVRTSALASPLTSALGSFTVCDAKPCQESVVARISIKVVCA